MGPTMESGLSRRRLLSAAGGLGAAAVAGTLLSGCGGGGDGGGGATGERVAPPTHTPFTGATPDIAGDPLRGIDDVFFSYPLPADQSRTVEAAPGTGGPLSTMVVTYSPPPAPRDQNAYWQAINEAMNVDYSSILVPEEFATKLAATLASNDVPDIVTSHVTDAWGLRGYASVVENTFADLSEYLSGDAAKQYPNLARLLPESWDATYVGGKIHATPTRRIQTANATFIRADRVRELGGNPAPGTADEFVEMCSAVTDRGAKRYALANEGTWLSGLIHPMFGVPNQWRLADDQSLVNYVETPEWQEAVRFTASLWKQGLWHPDSPAGTASKMEPLFANGSVMVRSDNFVRYTVRGMLNFEVQLVDPFLAGGGPAPHSVAGATDFLTFIKKGTPERVQECLRVLNYLSAPLGSQENFLRTFGVEGANHTIDGGRPLLTERGSSETTALSLRFVAGGPDVLFASNGDADIVKKMNAYQTAVADRRLTNPVAAVYAESAGRMSNVTQQITDTINDVVLGRKPDTALGEVAEVWRKDGGERLREEYQESLAALTGR